MWASATSIISWCIIALQQFSSGKFGSKTKLAIASSADTPKAAKIAKIALSLLEIQPNISVSQVLSTGWDEGFDENIQIGRQHPLSSNKALTHFPIISKATGISYDRMLYFDDCTWDDHCANVEAKCSGIVTQRTPNGLQVDDWEEALLKYHNLHS